MNAIKIAISLLKIPKLFVSLILFPLFLSFVLIGAQLFISELFLRGINFDIDTVKAAGKAQNKNSFVRKVIYGTFDTLPALQVCRWIEKDGIELPPSIECAPDRLDAAIISDHPKSFSIDPYKPFLDGNFTRVHICKKCAPDIIIHPNDSAAAKTEARSIFGLALIYMAQHHDGIIDQHIAAAEDLQRLKQNLGSITLKLPGFRQPVPISDAPIYLSVILHLAAIIIIALWLCLKAHRRVLDYFAKSGALSPLIVATGSSSLYSALWLLTFIRVGAFLLAVVPFSILNIRALAHKFPEGAYIFSSGWEALIWLSTLAGSFALATLLTSIADLKNRHSLLAWIYRYLPFSLCCLGSLVWLGLFLFEKGSLVRDFLVSLPVIGTLPILLAPICMPRIDVLSVHLILSLLLLVSLMRSNTNWFAAHVEVL